MLRLILSPSVGGTAGYLYDAVAALASSGGEAVLIVPEQYSFAAERIVLERLGTADAQRVEVLSFTRLANTVFNSVGWDKGKRLNEAGKILLMSRASLFRSFSASGLAQGTPTLFAILIIFFPGFFV